MYRDKLVALFGGDVTAIVCYHAFRLLWLALFVLMFRVVGAPHIEPPDVQRNASLNASSQHDPLLGLRFFAFLMVLLGHWFLVVFPVTEGANPVVAPETFWPLAGSPWCGVWVFFTLSGYLMATGFIRGRYSLDAVGIAKFYKRRAYRILPIYLSAALLVALFTEPQVFRVWAGAEVTRVLDLVAIDSRGAIPIGALWSVATECQFYLAVPFILVIAETLKHRPISFGLTLCASVGAVISHKLIASHGHNLANWHAMIYQPMIVNLDVFLIGVAVAYAVDALRGMKVVVPAAIEVGTCLLMTLYLIASYVSAATIMNGAPEIREGFISIAPVLTALATAAIVIIFELRRCSEGNTSSRVSSVLWWIITRGGTLTYVLYVWSEPVMLALRRAAPPTIDLTTSATYFVGIGLPVMVGVAVFFYETVERPYNKQ